MRENIGGLLKKTWAAAGEVDQQTQARRRAVAVANASFNAGFTRVLSGVLLPSAHEAAFD